MLLYKQTDFDLSDRSKDLVRKIFKFKWHTEFDHRMEVPQENIWKFTGVKNELDDFFVTKKLTIEYKRITVFLSNLQKPYNTNPHIDLIHEENNIFPVKTRFNILCQGNTDDSMFWWENCKWGDQRIIKRSFTTYNGISYRTFGVIGDSVEDRYKILGQPSFIKNKLLTSGSFIKTDIAHAINISPGPRLIVSIEIDKSIEEIFNE